MAFNPVQMQAASPRFLNAESFVNTPQPGNDNLFKAFAAMGQMQKDQASSRLSNVQADAFEAEAKQKQMVNDQTQRVIGYQREAQALSQDPNMQQQHMDAKQKLYAERSVLHLLKGEDEKSDVYRSYSEANNQDLRRLHALELYAANPGISAFKVSELTDIETIDAMDAWAAIQAGDESFQMIPDDKLEQFSAKWAEYRQDPLAWSVMEKQASDRLATRRGFEAKMQELGIDAFKARATAMNGMAANVQTALNREAANNRHAIDQERHAADRGLKREELNEKILNNERTFRNNLLDIGIKEQNSARAYAVGLSTMALNEARGELYDTQRQLLPLNASNAAMTTYMKALDGLQFLQGDKIVLPGGDEVTKEQVKGELYAGLVEAMRGRDRQISQQGTPDGSVPLAAIEEMKQSVFTNNDTRLETLGKKAIAYTGVLAVEGLLDPRTTALTEDHIKLGENLAKIYAKNGEGSLEYFNEVLKNPGVMNNKAHLEALNGPLGPFIDRYARERSTYIKAALQGPAGGVTE